MLVDGDVRANSDDAVMTVLEVIFVWRAQRLIAWPWLPARRVGRV